MPEVIHPVNGRLGIRIQKNWLYNFMLSTTTAVLPFPQILTSLSTIQLFLLVLFVVCDQPQDLLFPVDGLVFHWVFLRHSARSTTFPPTGGGILEYWNIHGTFLPLPYPVQVGQGKQMGKRSAWLLHSTMFLWVKVLALTF